LGQKNQGLSTYEKFLAILLAVDHWRPYLQVQEFTNLLDHRSLASLDEQRLNTLWQRKALTKLLGLRYRIVYKPGRENGVADALSRRAGELEIATITVSEPLWLQKVLSSYQTDASVQQMLQRLTEQGDSVIDFSLQDGLLCCGHRIWVGIDT
jgi:hypothetical protein